MDHHVAYILLNCCLAAVKFTMTMRLRSCRVRLTAARGDHSLIRIGGDNSADDADAGMRQGSRFFILVVL